MEDIPPLINAGGGLDKASVQVVVQVGPVEETDALRHPSSGLTDRFAQTICGGLDDPCLRRQLCATQTLSMPSDRALRIASHEVAAGRRE